MINQTRSHCGSTLLPSSARSRLSQAAMSMVKVIANGTDQTHPVVKSCPSRKAKRLSGFAAISHSVSEVEPLNGARVGLRPSQLGDNRLQLAFAKYWANLYGFNMSTLAMLD